MAVLVLLGGRVLGPADLYFKDQPKTISYTADVLLHSRWALPRDVLHQPATKPPLYNWIGAAAVVVTRSWSPFVLKLPSLLGAIGAIGAVFLITRRLLRDSPLRLTVAATAAAICLCNATAADLAYRARPDMLQAAFMIAAFACATIAVWPVDRPRRITRWAMGFWICVGAAALTKGPMAMLPAAYGLLLPVVLGRPRDVLRLKPLIGLPIAVVPFAAWFFFAYRQDPDFVYDVLLKGEALGRILTATPEGHVKQWWYGYVWWWGKAFVWSNTALVTAGVLLVLLATRRIRLDHPMVPPMLYTLVVLAGISLSAGKRIDYVLPAMLGSAIVAAFGLVTAADWVARRLPALLATLAPLARAGPAAMAALYALVVVYGFWTNDTKRPEVEFAWTNKAWAFAQQVDGIVGDDALVVLIRGKTPISTFLGRHHGNGVTDADFAASEWVLLPEVPGVAPVLASPPLPTDFARGHRSDLAVHALYRRADVPISVFRAERYRTLDWTEGQNVYRREEHFPPNWRKRQASVVSRPASRGAPHRSTRPARRGG